MLKEIPPFTEQGVLPADCEVTFQQLMASQLIHGKGVASEKPWDASWRLHLAHNAEILVRQLWQAGVQEVFLAGSFVEATGRPNDVDGYFIVENNIPKFEELRHRLQTNCQYNVWDWSFKDDPAFSNALARINMWHYYRVELYPHPLFRFNTSDGKVVDHITAYRLSKRGLIPKGILKMVCD